MSASQATAIFSTLFSALIHSDSHVTLDEIIDAEQQCTNLLEKVFGDEIYNKWYFTIGLTDCKRIYNTHSFNCNIEVCYHGDDKVPHLIIPNMRIQLLPNDSIDLDDSTHSLLDLAEAYDIEY